MSLSAVSSIAQTGSEHHDCTMPYEKVFHVRALRICVIAVPTSRILGESLDDYLERLRDQDDRLEFVTNLIAIRMLVNDQRGPRWIEDIRTITEHLCQKRSCEKYKRNPRFEHMATPELLAIIDAHAADSIPSAAKANILDAKMPHLLSEMRDAAKALKQLT